MVRTVFALSLVALVALGCSSGESNAGGADAMARADAAPADFMNIPLVTITGDSTSLEAFRGSVLLLVNTASKCGNTPQYAGLEEIYRLYKDSGLVVIGFPANNFGQQEPGTNEEIAKFCTEEYDVTFPMMAKISVKGDDINPLYAYLTEQSPFPGAITWNFNKFVVDRKGDVIARFDSKVEPMSDTLVNTIAGLL